jgi:nucleoside-diphosphate-sugar epimerase
MAESSLVLVTGCAGRIGQAVAKELQARGQRVRGFDRVANPDCADMVVGDLTDSTTVARAMSGVSALIHLAATPDDADFLTELVPNNVIGVYHILEAARQARVQRMVLASSGQVVWHQRLRGPLPVGVDVQPTPRAWYAACKVFLEAAGRAFAEAHPMKVIAVRLGWCPRNRAHVAELESQEWGPDVYLSPGDAGRFFACAVEAKVETPFAVVYATSKPRRRVYFDMDAARRLVGFEAKDTWPEGIEVIVEPGKP